MKKRVINIVIDIGLLILLAIIACTLITGCTQEEKESLSMEDVDYICKYDNFDRVKSEDPGYIVELRDRTTGVHYYVFCRGYRAALTPVYEADGSVRVSETPKSDKQKTIDELMKDHGMTQKEAEKVYNNIKGDD